MNTRTATNIVLAVSGLAVIVSGLVIWGKIAMPFMKPLHINAGLVMSIVCLVHAWTYRVSLLRCVGGKQGMALALVTIFLLSVSPFVVPHSPGKGRGQHRAEISSPVAEQSIVDDSGTKTSL